MIIAVVGAGGKTTLIRQLAARYRSQGKTVFVTTTTHMYIEEDTLLTDDAEVILAALQERGYAMAGVPEGEKIKALSQETFNAVCAFADVVLVEADGARQMALKYPNETEPVIPENADQVIVVWGPHSLGKPAGQVCHRPELVKLALDITDDTRITREHVKRLLQQGYLTPLQRKFPHMQITVYPPI